jgi:hypothetical protein
MPTATRPRSPERVTGQNADDHRKKITAPEGQQPPNHQKTP